MSILLRLLSYLKPYWQRTVLAYVCLLVTTTMSLLVPWIIKEVLDRGLATGDVQFMAVAGAGIVAIALFKSAFSFGQQYLNEWLSQRVAYDLRNQLYDHIQRLSFAFHDTAQTGQLMTRATSDVDAVRLFTGPGLLDSMNAVLLLTFITAILFVSQPSLALFAMLPLALVFVITIRFGRAIRPVFVRIQQQFARMSTVLQENLSGVRVVKAFVREDYEIRKYATENWALLQENLRGARQWSFNFPMMQFLSAVSTAIVLWYGGREVVAGQMSLGTLVAFNSYLLMLGQPVRRVGWVVNMMARANASGERIFELLDTTSAVPEKAGARTLPRVGGHVRFEHVGFGYGEAAILQDIDIDAEPGQLIALLGLTGSGKSTVVSLLPRFYDPSAGRITVDEVDLRDASLASLRRQIGVVLQETFLFSASMRDNIAYGRPDATLAEVVAAARAADAHEFIMSFEHGYETWVGERGITLSGGQKQRIAIARALLIDPRILILDDSTSSVDTETEYLIQQALTRLMEGRTTFVIAQRLTTILRADQIVVLEGGRIVQRGRHHDLLAQGGLYRTIYDLQLRDQEQARRDLAAGRAVQP